MSLFTYHETTIDTTGTQVIREKINWKSVAFVLIAILMVGLVYWAVTMRDSERGDFLPGYNEQMEKSITESIQAGRPLTKEQQEYLQGQVTQAQKQLQGQTTPTATPTPEVKLPAGANPGSWTVTIPERVVNYGPNVSPASIRNRDITYGPSLAKYTETPSAKGKVVVWIRDKERGGILCIANTYGKPLTFTLYENWLDKDGNVVDYNKRTFKLNANETWQDSVGWDEGPETYEVYVEVK